MVLVMVMVTVWRLQARHTAAADIKLRIDGPEAAADNAVEVRGACRL